MPGSNRANRTIFARTQFAYTAGMDDSQTDRSVRDAGAHFAEVITRAQDGTPTIITRNGQAVADVVPIEDFNALEDAIDRDSPEKRDGPAAERGADLQHVRGRRLDLRGGAGKGAAEDA